MLLSWLRMNFCPGIWLQFGAEQWRKGFEGIFQGGVEAADANTSGCRGHHMQLDWHRCGAGRQESSAGWACIALGPKAHSLPSLGW